MPEIQTHKGGVAVVTKVERMKAIMFSCGVSQEIVDQAVACAAAAVKPKKRGKSVTVAAPDETWIIDVFETRFWPAYPRRRGETGKSEARLRFLAIVKAGGNVEKIIDAVERLAAEWVPRTSRKPDDARFIPMAAVWLNKRRWDDEQGLPAEQAVTMGDIARAFEEKIRKSGNEQRSGNDLLDD